MEDLKQNIIAQFDRMFKDETSVRFDHNEKKYEISRVNSVYTLTGVDQFEGVLATIKYSKDISEFLTEWVLFVLRGYN